MMINESGNYKNAFINQGGDLHSVTAYNVLLKNKEILLKNKEIVKFDSVDKVLKYKELEPVKSYRFKSKSINFGLLFGMQAYTFAKGNLEIEWNLEECKNYIKENNLEDALRVNKKFILKDKHTFNDKYKVDKTDSDFCYYKTVSEDIRNKFFTTYYDLQNYMNDWKELCKKQGYSKSIFGGLRRLPFLLYNGKDENKKRFANYENISLNSRIQNMEVCIVNSAMIELHNWLKDNNKKSYLFLNIHDAIEMMLFKLEIKEVCLKIIDIFTRYYDYYNGINLEVEGNIADYFEKNQLWDLGEKWISYLR
jgi:DNA polymerase I-like protein with 3'-5' exonuclease and polymerase domains